MLWWQWRAMEKGMAAADCGGVQIEGRIAYPTGNRSASCRCCYGVPLIYFWNRPQFSVALLGPSVSLNALDLLLASPG